MFSNELIDGATTCLLENLINLANNGNGDPDSPGYWALRLQAMSDLQTLQNNLRNHERMSQILADDNLAKYYLSRGSAEV